MVGKDQAGDGDGDRYGDGDGDQDQDQDQDRDRDRDGDGDRYGDAASRARPSLHEVLDASAIISINSSALRAVSDLI